jgi:uncharacterized protein YecT (DUF1311 family)
MILSSPSLKAISALAALLLAAGCGESKPPAPVIQLPGDEAALVRIVTTAQAEGAKVENDMQLGGVKANRDSALCNELKSPVVENWVGKVENISSNSDGLGVLSVSIASKVLVKTWNNAFSDMTTKSLLQPGSPIFQAASTMKPGQQVSFSGRFFKGNSGDCLMESSMTLRGKVREPEFIFAFTSIAPYSPSQAATAPAPAPAAASVPSAAPVAATEPTPQPGSPTQDPATQAAAAAPTTVAEAPTPAAVSTASITPTVDTPAPAVDAKPAPSQNENSQALQPAAPVAVAPSFNCAKASNLIEELICKDEDLAKLDVKLASAYTESLKSSDDKPALKSAQLDWMKSRRNKCTNAQCLADAYAERIAQISN